MGAAPARGWGGGGSSVLARVSAKKPLQGRLWCPQVDVRPEVLPEHLRGPGMHDARFRNFPASLGRGGCGGWSLGAARRRVTCWPSWGCQPGGSPWLGGWGQGFRPDLSEGLGGVG